MRIVNNKQQCIKILLNKFYNQIKLLFVGNQKLQSCKMFRDV